MRCGRCGASMLKTEFSLSNTHERIKTVTAWRCDKCERVEYYSGESSLSRVASETTQKSGGSLLSN